MGFAFLSQDLYISNAGVHGPNPDRFLAAVKYIMEHQPRLAPGPIVIDKNVMRAPLLGDVTVDVSRVI